MKLLKDQKGMALLLVLVIVALLSALLTEFSFSTLVDMRATETFRDRTQAFYLARGGVEAARLILRQDRNSYDHPSEFWGGLPPVPVDDGDINLKIEDLSGRLNLLFVADNRGNPKHGYYSFIELCEKVLSSTPAEARDMADAVKNWLNTDFTQVTLDDSYYARQDPPVKRDGTLETLEDLLKVRYFDEEKISALKDYVRVNGDEAINVNTAPEEVLYAWQISGPAGTLPIIFDQQDIDALIEYRQQTPFTKLSDLGLAQGIGSRWSTAWLSGSVDVKASVFQAISNGRINDVTRRVDAVIQKSGKIIGFRVE